MTRHSQSLFPRIRTSEILAPGSGMPFRTPTLLCLIYEFLPASEPVYQLRGTCDLLRPPRGRCGHARAGGARRRCVPLARGTENALNALLPPNHPTLTVQRPTLPTFARVRAR